MQVELTERQLRTLITLTTQRLWEIAAEAESGDQESPPSGQKREWKAIRELRDYLQREAQEAAEHEAWRGYVESRRMPSNSAPGGPALGGPSR